MTRLVLFGAGASFGSPSILPFAPPLGSGLYEQLAKSFPNSWGGVPYALGEEFRKNFEIGMATLWDSGSHTIPILMQHMAIYFANFNVHVSGTDSYSLFLKRLDADGKLAGTIFSTLNYECLFEIAVSNSGRAVAYSDEGPGAESAITLLKLHGSCNFIPSGGAAVSRAASFSPGAVINSTITPVSPADAIAYCNSNTALYPVMSIFTKGKPVQISPFVTESLQSIWKTAIENAESVSIIGVNPNPDDKHIWEPLALTDASVSMVGNEEAIQNWFKLERKGRTSKFVGSRFHGCIDDIATSI